MAKFKCKRFRTVTGKKGRIRGVRVKRCADFGVRDHIKGGLYLGGKTRKRARRVR